MITKRHAVLAMAALSLVAMTQLALAGVPDPALSTATSASGCLTIKPGGSKMSLAAAGLTITVTVIDGNTDPIPGYPFQDIWLDDPGTGHIALCAGGSVADANTNASGVTTISGTIAGGGWTQSGMQVYLAGVALTGPNLLIQVNSPDINGDLVVNLADLGLFATDFNACAAEPPVCNFRSDFLCDGAGTPILNLVEVGEFAEANGESCP